MNSLSFELLARKQRLEKAIRSAEQFLQNAPEGRLRISNRSSGTRFFCVTQSYDTCGLYIPSGNEELISQLAQKDYALKFIKEARKELSIIENCIHDLSLHNSESVYTELRKEREVLVSPYMADNENSSKKWLSLPFQTSNYEIQEKVFHTKQGEMVRSKSELILADIYFELGIPYRYECELILKNGSTNYPDFTLFHAPRRLTIYHEHLGRMDDEDYVNRNLKKLRAYEQNGIILGKNLILTFESKRYPLNPDLFREYIKEIFWLK